VRFLAAELLERVDGPHKSTTIFDRHQMTTLATRTFLKLDMPQQPEEPGPKAGPLKVSLTNLLEKLSYYQLISLHNLVGARGLDLDPRAVLLRFLR
jgi:hypothetical protein